jgi:signal transduction histidine kinase
LGTLSWLSRRHLQDRELEYVRRGESAVARVVEQLDHLIKAVRVHERATTLVLKPVQVGPLVAAVCQDHADLAAQKNLRLCCCPTTAKVMSDATLLEGILSNLVRNALKYTPPGGKVLVGCRRHGCVARIEVFDTGIGIPEDQLSGVFQAFHRVDSGCPDGLGLGLFIVRRAVDLLGHRINIRSAEGRGTCFSVAAQLATGTSTKYDSSVTGSDLVGYQDTGAVADLDTIPARYTTPVNRDTTPLNRALIAVCK